MQVDFKNPRLLIPLIIGAVILVYGLIKLIVTFIVIGLLIGGGALLYSSTLREVRKSNTDESNQPEEKPAPDLSPPVDEPIVKPTSPRDDSPSLLVEGEEGESDITVTPIPDGNQPDSASGGSPTSSDSESSNSTTDRSS